MMAGTYQQRTSHAVARSFDSVRHRHACLRRLPGPAVLYTVAQTMARGRGGGLLAAAGLSVGGLAHVCAAAAGLSTIFKYSPTLFLALKIGGALYLVWLGVRMFRNRGASALPSIAAKSSRRALAESILVELLNPKTALFFIAFLPQFVDGGESLPIWLQLLVLGLVVNLSFFTSDVIAALLTDRVLTGLRQSPRVARAMRWTSGSVLVGLGAHMTISRN
jgi:threonine/homoserine/homoserine lactone efflux protein